MAEEKIELKNEVSELTNEEVNALTIRNNILSQKKLEFDLLNNENALFIKQLIMNKGLDLLKSYKVIIDSGKHLLVEMPVEVKPVEVVNGV